jgi:RNA polymerase sigma-70 factor (ECF subfamily)
MIPRDQLAHRPASISTNQKWQLLVDEMQARWNADDSERAEELFYEFYEMSFPLLITIARAKAPIEMAEDVVAEAYLEFYEMLAAHKPIRNAKGLLCQIARRRSIDEYRRYERRKRVTAQVDETMWSGLRELPDVLADTPEETVVSLDTAHFASNLILDALPDEERRVLILRHVQELSVSETARQLNMTEDQVKKRTQRALSHAYRVAQERGLLHDLS